MDGIDPNLKEFSKGLPTRDNCDLTDPYEMFLWCFVALPYVRGGPLIMPMDYYQLVSKRLHDVGLMLTCENCGHTKEPTLAYRQPGPDDPDWATTPGEWLPVPTPVDEQAALAVPMMTTQQLQDLMERTQARRRELGIGDNT